MSMPHAKKAAIEKLMVAGLLAVFGWILTKGPLMKVLRPPVLAPAALPPVQPVAGGSAAPADAALPSGQEVAVAPSASRKYAAQEFRDPFESRLPAAMPQGLAGTGTRFGDQDYTSTGLPGSGTAQAVSGSGSNLQVEGMFWGGARPQAIINGQIYGVNETVNGMTIISIDHRGVAVDHGGRPVYYPLSTASLSGGGGGGNDAMPAAPYLQ